MHDTTRVWGGRTVAERVAERREAVLKAAIDIVGEHGTTALTTKAVCARAGVAERRLYESFASRDALLLEVFDACLALAGELVAAAFMGNIDGALLDRVRNALTVAADAVFDEPAIVRVLFIDAVSHPALRGRSQTLQLAMEALVTQLISGDLEAVEIDNATVTFGIGGLVSAFTAWVSGRLDMSREEIVEAAVRMLGRLLGLDRAEERGVYADEWHR